MKVIGIGNDHAGDRAADVAICTNCDRYFAGLIAELLNKKFASNTAPYHYEAVEDDHELYNPS